MKKKFYGSEIFLRIIFNKETFLRKFILSIIFSLFILDCSSEKVKEEKQSMDFTNIGNFTVLPISESFLLKKNTTHISFIFFDVKDVYKFSGDRMAYLDGIGEAFESYLKRNVSSNVKYISSSYIILDEDDFKNELKSEKLLLNERGVQWLKSLGLNTVIYILEDSYVVFDYNTRLPDLGILSFVYLVSPHLFVGATGFDSLGEWYGELNLHFKIHRLTSTITQPVHLPPDERFYTGKIIFSSLSNDDIKNFSFAATLAGLQKLN